MTTNLKSWVSNSSNSPINSTWINWTIINYKTIKYLNFLVLPLCTSFKFSWMDWTPKECLLSSQAPNIKLQPRAAAQSSTLILILMAGDSILQGSNLIIIIQHFSSNVMFIIWYQKMKNNKQIKPKINNFSLENDKQAAKWEEMIVFLLINREGKELH